MCDLGNFIPKTISTVSSVLRLLKEGSVIIRAITYVKQELLAWDILEGKHTFHKPTSYHEWNECHDHNADGGGV